MNGKGSVWTGRKESEERICTTEVWIKDTEADVFLANSFASLEGTTPDGKTENT